MVGNHITRVISGSGNYRKFPVITRADFWLPGNDPWGGKVKRVSKGYVFSYLRGFDFLQPFLWRTYGLPEAPRRVRPVRAMS